MQKTFLIIAAFAGLTAVGLGAFGAHGLKPHISADQLHAWETAVQYQMYHALALFMCFLYLRKEAALNVRNAAICFILGILCFSGSLYLLATQEFTGIPGIILGPITPIGGLFFISGWSLILIQALKKDSSSD